MKKILKSILLLLAVLHLAACADESAKKGAAEISLNAAEETALADAGLTSAEVDFIKSKAEQSDGISFFHVEFYADGMKYEYEIHAETGAVNSKSREPYSEQKETDDTGAANENPNTAPDTTPQDTENRNQLPQQDRDNSGQITLDAAKEAALSDAGLTAADVTFTEAYLDYEDGVAVYDIEFYTATHEYKYEINAVSGAIYSKSAEAFDAGRHWDWDEHHDEDWYHRHGGNSRGAWTAETDIGAEAAKDAALSHAGLSSSEVRFTKAEFDWEDGIAVYEIEFYKDATEYEYKINASDGTILEYDVGH